VAKNVLKVFGISTNSCIKREKREKMMDITILVLLDLFQEVSSEEGRFLTILRSQTMRILEHQTIRSRQ
jgi:hypothetical protein